MIQVPGKVEIGDTVDVHGFTFEFKNRKRVLPLVLIGQREALQWAKKRIQEVLKENAAMARACKGDKA